MSGVVAPEGVGVGHWTDTEARTGCTVIVLPPGSTASGEIRGGAPATREFALLEPTRLVDSVDAVVMTGGSAFGLAAADGVTGWLEEHGRGHPTNHGVVPIVPAMALYDLGVGRADVRPAAIHGAHAAEAAVVGSGGEVRCGRLGAGAGATQRKWLGPDHVADSGFGAAIVERRGVRVAAFVAANPLGSIGPPGDADAAAIIEGSFDHDPEAAFPGANTTIATVVTTARFDAAGCHLLAQSAHDGFARAIYPSHLSGDGDAVVVASVGEDEAMLDVVRAMTIVAVEQAILRSP